MPTSLLDTDELDWPNDGSAIVFISDEGSSVIDIWGCFVGEVVGCGVSMISAGTNVDTIVSISSSVVISYSFVGTSVGAYWVGSFVDWVGMEVINCVGLLLGLSLPFVGNEVGLIVCSSDALALALAQNWSSTSKHSQPYGQLLLEHGIDSVLQFELASF